MEAKKRLNGRHKQARSELKKVAMPYIDGNSLNSVAMGISKKLGISFQTVVNYVHGRAKDGYLTEAITNEFKLISNK